MHELIAKLERNARFYEQEAGFLAQDLIRRDSRHLGSMEAAQIAGLLKEAANALRGVQAVAGNAD